LTVTRRTLLKLILSGLGFGGLLGSIAYSKRKEIYYKFLALDIDPLYGILSEVEMENIVALAEVLLPTEPQVESSFIIRYVNDRTNKGRLNEYRRAVNLLNKEVVSQGYQKDFSDLTKAERIEVLTHLIDPEVNYSFVSGSMNPLELTKRGYELILNRDRLRFRKYVVEDILFAFYSSAGGWSIVGYTNFPGVPGPLLDYTQPPSNA
jgi:hypothetical protein